MLQWVRTQALGSTPVCHRSEAVCLWTGDATSLCIFFICDTEMTVSQGCCGRLAECLIYLLNIIGGTIVSQCPSKNLEEPSISSTSGLTAQSCAVPGTLSP